MRKGVILMISEKKKHELVSQISNLSNEQVEALEEYILELADAQSGQQGGGKKYLVFMCREQAYGIAISQIVQIKDFLGIDIISLPNTDLSVKGVMSLREDMIPIIDFGLRLGKPEVKYSKKTCIVIVTVQNQPLGLIVDSVRNVVTIYDEDVYAPPVQGNMEVHCLTGIAKTESVVLLLDANLFIAESELGFLADISSEIGNKEK